MGPRGSPPRIGYSLGRVQGGISSSPSSSRPPSRDPYVDGPRAARVFRWSDRIACIHMSGLLVRFGGPLAKMVFRGASSKHRNDLYRPMGPADFLAHRVDRSYHLSPFAASAQPVGTTDRLIS